MSQKDIVQELVGALNSMREAMRDIADASGDVPEWNKGGAYYEACRDADRALEEASEAHLANTGPVRIPRIGLHVEGGVIHAMFADTPAQVTVIDYDDDGGDEASYIHVPQGDGSTARACAAVWAPEIEIDQIEKLAVAVAASWPSPDALPRMRELCKRAGIRLVESQDGVTAGRWGWIDDDAGDASEMNRQNEFDAGADVLDRLFREDWNNAVDNKETTRDFLDYVEHEGLPHYLDEAPGVSP